MENARHGKREASATVVPEFATWSMSIFGSERDEGTRSAAAEPAETKSSQDSYQLTSITA
jgi:hypothetical protein